MTPVTRWPSCRSSLRHDAQRRLVVLDQQHATAACRDRCTGRRSALRRRGRVGLEHATTGSSTVNVAPRPRPSLRAVIVPPCASASCRLIASPSPSPACCRAARTSPCSNALNSLRQHGRVDARAGVDHFDADAAVAGASIERTVIVPSGGVNFMRVVDQVPEDLLQPRAVAADRVAGRRRSTVSLADASRWQMSIADADDQVQVDVLHVELELACAMRVRSSRSEISRLSSSTFRRMVATSSRRSVGQLRVRLHQRDRQQHRRERRAQLVRQRRQELALGLAGPLGLRARRALAFKQSITLPFRRHAAAAPASTWRGRSTTPASRTSR